jgi:hypothetical protein
VAIVVEEAGNGTDRRGGPHPGVPCGRRRDDRPGTVAVALALQAGGFAPLAPRPRLARSGITELACASAETDAKAQVSSGARGGDAAAVDAR